MSERDFTSEELQALEELVDLQDTDPALFERVVQEGFEDAERKEHGETLLGMIDNATDRRQEQDAAFLDALIRAQSDGDDDAA